MGRLAAASGKSQPVFYGRCGILTDARCSGFELRENSIANPVRGVPMRSSRKQNSRKSASKQLPAKKQRKNPEKKNEAPPARTQWLQILSEDVDEDQAQDRRGPVPARNGRRVAPEMNLYVVERISGRARRFR